VGRMLRSVQLLMQHKEYREMLVRGVEHRFPLR